MAAARVPLGVRALLTPHPPPRLAKLGYQAFVRAYATHPRRLKAIFSPHELHLGHVAHAFGLGAPLPYPPPPPPLFF